MTTFIKRSAYTLLVTAIYTFSLSFTGNVLADTNRTLSESLTGGKLNVNLRYRFENVDDDTRPEEAHASTIRARLAYTTKTFRHFQVSIEVDHLEAIGGDNYDDLHGDTIDHAVVADPEGTEINQVWIAYSGIDNTEIKIGRQRINLDNQRFIGGVGWRQNEQTYDSITVVNSSLPYTNLFYAHISNVNRIFGPNSGRAGTSAADVNLDSDAHIFNINYRDLSIGTLSAYAYLLDIDDNPVNHALSDTLSTKTLGARLSGSQGEETKFLYTAEFAHQSDYKNNPTSYNANYYNFEAGLQVKQITAKLGLEVLETDDEKAVAFSTPLATLHKFQGFADKFLSTPANGIKDSYASVFTKLLGAKVGIIYHDFDADKGSADYGNEVDFIITKQVHKNIHLLLKYANYNAKDFATDTEKVWLQFTINF